MQNMKLYKNLEPLIAGSMVRLDSPLFSAVMNEAVKAGIPSYANFVRAILAATCLDKTYGDITPPQGQLVAGNTYYTESDIQGYESQIETLKSRVSEYTHELNMRDVKLQHIAEQHQIEVAILKAKIPPNLPNLGVIKNESQSNLGNYNQPSQDQDLANKPVIPTNLNQVGSTQNQSNQDQNQSGLELSEYGMNKPDIEPIALNMEEIIQDKFLEVVGNQLVIEYFNQQTKLNQRFGISGFNGVFKVVEEIPNSLLEHHPLVVYWKKRVGQFENAVVNATEAFFQQDHTVQQMSQNEQLALNALIKREQMLWWLITHFTTIRGFDHKYCNYLIETVRTYCQGFPVIPNPYHENILEAQQQQHGERTIAKRF